MQPTIEDNESCAKLRPPIFTEQYLGNFIVRNGVVYKFTGTNGCCPSNTINDAEEIIPSTDTRIMECIP